MKPSAAHLYNRSDIIYTSNATAKYLQREVARRRAVYHNSTDQIQPGDANHRKMLTTRPPTIQQCIEELHLVGPNYTQVESNHILAYWNRFKRGLRTRGICLPPRPGGGFVGPNHAEDEPLLCRYHEQQSLEN
jgi:hypothetical protein